MAMITCPDCNKDISDAAPACPGCGRPFKQRVFYTSDGPILERSARKRSGLSLSRIMVFGAIGCLVYAFFSPSKNQPTEVLAPRQTEDPGKQARLREFIDSTNLGWYGGDHNLVSFDTDPEPSGAASCNVRISPGRRPQGQAVSIKSVSGTKSFDIEIFKESWRIPAGSVIPVSIDFGGKVSFVAQARGFSREASFHIPVDLVSSFNAHLLESQRMTISFPKGDEPSWGVSLDGILGPLAEQRRCALARIMKNSSSQPL